MYDTHHSSSRTGQQHPTNGTAEAAATTSASAQASSTTQQQQQQQQFAQEFWEEQIQAAEQFDSDFKNHPLPLARIKKVMKSDPEVKMISAEAPILFSKACEIFICEITRRAWLHAEENKRRTLQRSDVANAVSRSDQFDFLIDIVPREEPSKPSKRSSSTRGEDPSPADAEEGGADVYDEQDPHHPHHQQQQQQQQQQHYAQYYPQGAGGLAGYSHNAIDPQFYQAVSHDQLQHYLQYQQAYQAQQPPASSQQQHQQPPSGSRNGSVSYSDSASRQS
ncbi:hypothetical protein KVV02_003739 [Mortierella alpina]|uniref:Core Histone H2A/H2B/H3 domain-containing protein n=1 Tax=Mortierella alpina TaxID=64518 RepID=A0A9P8A146_MORAP|nr:hypothetical protein KVV02_003739 [Mortierella alpina]